MPTPLLVVEIESDSTRRRDRSVKRVAYLESLRVAEYWLIDPRAETLNVCTVGGEDRRVGSGQTIRWSPRPDVPPFELALTELFRPVD